MLSTNHPLQRNCTNEKQIHIHITIHNNNDDNNNNNNNNNNKRNNNNRFALCGKLLSMFQQKEFITTQRTTGLEVIQRLAGS